jgi:glycosyltransferase involved in cell wall biosynthesis
MRFHLPALQGQPVKRENSSCAFTAKIWKFAKMMTARGHEVFIYGGGGCDAPGATYVPTYGKMAPPGFGAADYFDGNMKVIPKLAKHLRQGDFICLPMGLSQKAIADAFPNICSVEYGIGYGGSYAEFKIFESYAWMHATYALDDGPSLNDASGRFFDAVVPNYFDVDDFPAGDGDGGYLLFVGRMIQEKGIELAGDVAIRSEMPLYVAGAGPLAPSGVPDLRMYGPVGPEKRAELMGGALAVLVPTYYLEPFGGVAVEAMLCGTPAITTDWGAFPETVEQGVTGWRCKTIGEFLAAVDKAGAGFDRGRCRRVAQSRYSLEAIAPRYERHFDRLAAVQSGEGFYDPERVPGLPDGS